LKGIGRYLIGTANRGLVIQPTNELKVDCYVDADFAGVFNIKDANDGLRNRVFANIGRCANTLEKLATTTNCIIHDGGRIHSSINSNAKSFTNQANSSHIVTSTQHTNE
jgi:hypothetical protein